MRGAMANKNGIDSRFSNFFGLPALDSVTLSLRFAPFGAHNRRLYGFGSCRPYAQIPSLRSGTSYSRQSLYEICFFFTASPFTFL